MSADTHFMLRPMLPADVPALAAIFRAGVAELTADDYDDAQREAWASAAADAAAFGARLLSCLTLVATMRGAPVGFITLEGQSHIDMLYVDPRMVRQGVGSLLCEAVEKLAAGRGAKQLDVDASDTARPFFEAKGFEARHRQTVERGDCWLGNTRMRKTISA